MAKFRFRFHAVGRVRRLKEEEALKKFGEAQKKLDIENERLNELNRKLIDSLDRRAGLGKEATLPSHFSVETDFIEGTKVRIKLQFNRIQKAKKIVTKALKDYLEAKRSVKMIDVIEEKHRAEFKKELRKKEQRELEEIYVAKGGLKVED